VSGGSAFYVGVYSIFYFFTKVTVTSTILETMVDPGCMKWASESG